MSCIIAGAEGGTTIDPFSTYVSQGDAGRPGDLPAFESFEDFYQKVASTTNSEGLIVEPGMDGEAGVDGDKEYEPDAPPYSPSGKDCVQFLADDTPVCL